MYCTFCLANIHQYQIGDMQIPFYLISDFHKVILKKYICVFLGEKPELSHVNWRGFSK